MLLASVRLSTVVTPTTFLPIEDRGRFITVIRTPEGSTTAYTQRALAQVEKLYLAEPEIEGFFASIGIGFGSAPSSSIGLVFSRLRHWDERDVKQQEIVEKLLPASGRIPEALVFPVNPPGLSRRSQADVEIVIKAPGASLDELAEVVGARSWRACASCRALVNVDSDLRAREPAARHRSSTASARPTSACRWRRWPRACACWCRRAPPTTSSCATSSTTW